MNPLLISASFILFTTTIALLLRILIKKSVNDGIVKQLLLEFVATAELCAICFELIIVSDNYGVWTYALFLFLLTMWWSRAWEFESACPYMELEKVVEGKQQYKTALMIIVAQILGGILVYYYVYLLWSLELTETHRGKAQEECKADLQLPLQQLALQELIGVFLVTFPNRCIRVFFGRYAPYVRIVWGILLSFLKKMGYGYSACINSAIGTSLAMKCMPFRNIIVVYWIGSHLGAMLAFLLIKRVSAAVGTGIEGFFTCLCRLASRLLSDSNARFASIADPFFATMMVVAAFNYSGGYFNPALATSLKVGCDGHTYVEFIMVYWVGACAGAVASIYCYNSDSFQHFAQRFKPKLE